MSIRPETGLRHSHRNRLEALEGEALSHDDKTFALIAKRYEGDIIPGKPIHTQRDNLAELAKLLKIFGAVPIDAIRPQDVRTNLDLRGQTAKVRANRERGLSFELLSCLQPRVLSSQLRFNPNQIAILAEQE